LIPDRVTLEGHGIRLEPLRRDHGPALAEAASDGSLWELWYTSVPEPEEVEAWIRAAGKGLEAGHMLPWAVRVLDVDTVVGSTRYHDIVPDILRLEIGHTWYARRWQGTHVNTACKLLLLEHAFDTLGYRCVGFRTDRFNASSRKAIAALGAREDGIIRHHQPRRDGSVRDTVMFSILAQEWPDVRRHLESRLRRLV
jgi:RimJ/RimL family protein N-acetyltransferase